MYVVSTREALEDLLDLEGIDNFCLKYAERDVFVIEVNLGADEMESLRQKANSIMPEGISVEVVTKRCVEE